MSYVLFEVLNNEYKQVPLTTILSKISDKLKPGTVKCQFCNKELNKNYYPKHKETETHIRNEKKYRRDHPDENTSNFSNRKKCETCSNVILNPGEFQTQCDGCINLLDE